MTPAPACEQSSTNTRAVLDAAGTNWANDGASNPHKSASKAIPIEGLESMACRVIGGEYIVSNRL